MDHTRRFDGDRLREIREEAGQTQLTLASGLGIPWSLIALWESSQVPQTPKCYPANEPTASQLMDLARVLNGHPLDFFHSYEDAPASKREEDRALRMASGIRLDGRELTILRRVKGLSIPQAATRARVSQEKVKRGEEGRTINAGALLRLLQVYEPKKDPRSVIAEIVLMGRRARRS